VITDQVRGNFEQKVASVFFALGLESGTHHAEEGILQKIIRRSIVAC